MGSSIIGRPVLKLLLLGLLLSTTFSKPVWYRLIFTRHCLGIKFLCGNSVEHREARRSPHLGPVGVDDDDDDDEDEDEDNDDEEEALADFSFYSNC